jgi:hypothetical protein
VPHRRLRLELELRERVHWRRQMVRCPGLHQQGRPLGLHLRRHLLGHHLHQRRRRLRLGLAKRFDLRHLLGV